MLAEHRCRQDRRGRIRLLLARDVGRAAVHRLEHAGRGALRIDIPTGRQADADRSIAADRIVAVGSAFCLPAMSGALPCTGSNMLGAVRSGLIFPLAASPMPPATAAPRSGRMSPKRLSVTTTPNRSGWVTRYMQAASTWQ